MTKALLALEDGSLFWGDSIGADGVTVGEVVFNTAMTGYQEILTDPSYSKQIVALTYPHIGNVGTNPEDEEAISVMAAGLIVRDHSIVSSNWRSTNSLDEYLKENQTIAIANIDTRRLTRILRDKGAQAGCIIAGSAIDESAAIKQAKSFSGLSGLDLAKEVSTGESYHWRQGSWQLASGLPQDTASFDYNVVVYDFAVKRNILRMLVDRKCELTVVPAKTPAAAVLDLKPDGVFLSNGPGDPEPCTYAQDAIKVFLEKNIPLFGICLGHQLLALAAGAKSTKMKFGHHGANHPVQDLGTGEVVITSQNHGFAIDEASLPLELKSSHRSLFDGSLQGIKHASKPAFGFQGHPEASPGPHDVGYLFDKFIKLMRLNKSDA